MIIFEQRLGKLGMWRSQILEKIPISHLKPRDNNKIIATNNIKVSAYLLNTYWNIGAR